MLMFLGYVNKNKKMKTNYEVLDDLELFLSEIDKLAFDKNISRIIKRKELKKSPTLIACYCPPIFPFNAGIFELFREPIYRFIENIMFDWLHSMTYEQAEDALCLYFKRLAVHELRHKVQIKKRIIIDYNFYIKNSDSKVIQGAFSETIRCGGYETEKEKILEVDATFISIIAQNHDFENLKEILLCDETNIEKYL